MFSSFDGRMLLRKNVLLLFEQGQKLPRWQGRWVVQHAKYSHLVPVAAYYSEVPTLQSLENQRTVPKHIR